jgi:plastocyanin
MALISGCISVPSSPKSSSPEMPGTTSQPPVMVSIKARSFNPAIITIKEGPTVIWTNEDPIMHRVVHLPEANRPELFNSGPLPPGRVSATCSKRMAGLRTAIRRSGVGDPILSSLSDRLSGSIPRTGRQTCDGYRIWVYK